MAGDAVLYLAMLSAIGFGYCLGQLREWARKRRVVEFEVRLLKRAASGTRGCRAAQAEKRRRTTEALRAAVARQQVAS